MLKPSFINSK